MVDNSPLFQLFQAIARGDTEAASGLLAGSPQLATTRLVRGATRAESEEYFLDEVRAHVYAGDTALHIAAFAYDSAFARKLVGAGADVRAGNRRGAEPLHSAANGGPGSPTWNPRRQAAVIAYLVEAGADPNATAMGGVTPLHRAVRNRCTPAVRALLAAGADPHRRNDSGSTAFTLAEWNTGRSGSGSAEAKQEQANIVRLLAATL